MILSPIAKAMDAQPSLHTDSDLKEHLLQGVWLSIHRSSARMLRLGEEDEYVHKDNGERQERHAKRDFCPREREALEEDDDGRDYDTRPAYHNLCIKRGACLERSVHELVSVVKKSNVRSCLPIKISLVCRFHEALQVQMCLFRDVVPIKHPGKVRELITPCLCEEGVI